MAAFVARRFVYTSISSHKFWEIYEPYKYDGEWVVDVMFGKVGGWTQEHRNVFHYESEAKKHYHRKIAEKLAKGYKEQGKVAVKDNVVNYTPTLPKPKPKPVCSHVNLTRSGDTWKCVICKKQIEFDKPAAENLTLEVVETKVRRFFAKRPE